MRDLTQRRIPGHSLAMAVTSARRRRRDPGSAREMQSIFLPAVAIVRDRADRGTELRRTFVA
jgi:hypothetical protein